LQAEIPIGFRIFAVADTLDAITSDRPYRSAQHFEDRFKVIHSESGRLFDPQITGAFFSLPKETWPAIAMHQHQASSLPSWLRNGGGAAPLTPLWFLREPNDSSGALFDPPRGLVVQDNA
jgi:cyclic di-GMP phosphodiesterase